MLILGDNTGNEPTAAPIVYGDSLSAAQPNGASLGPFPQVITPGSSALSAPSTPYTAHRAIIHSLTLPTKPNLDIPQSPHGSPTANADQKCSRFLELKGQGVHFNTKLASSSALKNPSLLPKLMEFAGVGSERQYATTLSFELWDPAVFPSWAYKEELAELQHGLSRKKESERARLQRESVDFVATGPPGQTSGLIVPKGTRASAAERVIVGLSEDKNPSQQLSTPGVQNEVESKGRTSESLRAGNRLKSPRRRKGSRSG